ncbi:MAG: hypothetical protein ACI8YQ_003444 [Polaribacter sp.]
MITKKFYSTRIILFFSLCFTFGFTFAQDCGPLSLDSISNPGAYTYGSLTEADGIRNGPDYNGATIYYPTNATAPFTGMAIVPGFISPQSSIQNWGPFLASHGIVTMTIGTNSLFDQPGDRGDALLDALITLKEENTRSDSPLFGNMDTTRLGVGGWSMGGGGAQLAAAMDTTIKAVMALCPWLDSGQLTAGDLDHPVPVLFFSGEDDTVAPPDVHAAVHYDYTPLTTSKMLFEIASGDHSIANDPIGGGEYVGKIAVSWLKHFLVGDPCYCPLVVDAPPTASTYLLNVECPAIVSTERVIVKENFEYQLYPNPTNGSINLDVENLETGTSYQIHAMTGAKITAGEILNQSTNISLEGFASGIYFINVRTAEVSMQARFIVN